ncbi:MAG: PH domain-containing protein [Patescibacteria group bacterium]
MNIHEYLSKQLQAGEEVIQIVRRHPATLVPSVGGGGALLLIDFFLVAWWFRHSSWGVVGFSLVLVFGLVVIIRGVYVWSQNVLAVTTQRVIDIDQRGFFERHVAETTYDKIQDVRYTIRGLWSTIFRFGTIVLQTAGATTNLELTAVRQPVELQRLITDLQRQANVKPPSELGAADLVTVIGRLKAELGPAGVERVLRKSPPLNHG